jgi:hypothetical protein
MQGYNAYIDANGLPPENQYTDMQNWPRIIGELHWDWWV